MVDWDWLLYQIWDMWDDFDLSISWGNIATVTVAIAAIIISAWFNVRTLRSADDRWRQERLDTRDDKLRAELATLLAMVSELEIRRNAALGRLFIFMNALNPNQLTDEQLQQPARQAASMVLTELADLRKRIHVSGITIHMLTANQDITLPVDLIQRAMDSERSAYVKALAVPEIRNLTPDSLRKRLVESRIWSQMGTQRVIDYCLQCLGTNIPDTRSPAAWNNPWNNPWANRWR
jgi:hypothetical protein